MQDTLRMTPDQKALWDRLESFEFDATGSVFTFAARLARDNRWGGRIHRARHHRVLAVRLRLQPGIRRRRPTRWIRSGTSTSCIRDLTGIASV